MILVPVVLGFPAMVFPIPPLVKLPPTLLSFGIQIASAIISLTAVRTFPLYSLIESSFGFFDSVLAIGAIVKGASLRGRYRNRKEKCRGHHCCGNRFSKFQLPSYRLQENLLSCLWSGTNTILGFPGTVFR